MVVVNNELWIYVISKLGKNAIDIIQETLENFLHKLQSTSPEETNGCLIIISQVSKAEERKDN